MNPAESTIRAALEKAAQYHREDGLDPNASIIKTASDMRLNPHMVERVVEAFNIAKTNAVLSQVQDKTASFPVAERDVILDGVFGHGLGQAPAREQKTASDETTPEFREIPYSPALPGSNTKVAEMAASYDVPRLVRDGISGLMEFDADLRKVAGDVAASESDMVRALRDIGDWFQLSENYGKFAEFEADILSSAGYEAKPSLDIIHRHFCAGHKRCDQQIKLGSRSYEETLTHSKFAELQDLTDAFIQKEGELKTMTREFTSKKAEFDSALQELTGNGPQPAPDAASFFQQGVSGTPKTAASREIPDGSACNFVASPMAGHGKTAAGLDSIKDLAGFGLDVSPASIAQQSASSIGGQIGDSYHKSRKLDYEVPKAEARHETDNIKRQTILHDLMTNDEIISKHHPKDVERVYNTMLSIAPNVTLFPGIVQSVLRSSLSQQAVDPFTAKQFADLEGAHHKNRMLAKDKISPTAP